MLVCYQLYLFVNIIPLYNMLLCYFAGIPTIKYKEMRCLVKCKEMRCSVKRSHFNVVPKVMLWPSCHLRFEHKTTTAQLCLNTKYPALAAGFMIYCNQWSCWLHGSQFIAANQVVGCMVYCSQFVGCVVYCHQSSCWLYGWLQKIKLAYVILQPIKLLVAWFTTVNQFVDCTVYCSKSSCWLQG